MGIVFSQFKKLNNFSLDQSKNEDGVCKDLLMISSYLQNYFLDSTNQKDTVLFNLFGSKSQKFVPPEELHKTYRSLKNENQFSGVLTDRINNLKINETLEEIFLWGDVVYDYTYLENTVLYQEVLNHPALKDHLYLNLNNYKNIFPAEKFYEYACVFFISEIKTKITSKLTKPEDQNSFIIYNSSTLLVLIEKFVEYFNHEFFLEKQNKLASKYTLDFVEKFLEYYLSTLPDLATRNPFQDLFISNYKDKLTSIYFKHSRILEGENSDKKFPNYKKFMNLNKQS